MTVRKIIEIHCDLCKKPLKLADGVERPDSVVTARQLAHVAGWTHDRLGRDVCSDCRTFKIKRTPKIVGQSDV